MIKPVHKEVFPLGKHVVTTKSGERKEVIITKEMALDWINKFNAMRSKGLRVTAPWEHDIEAVPVEDILNAKNNGGEWTSLYLKDDIVKGVLLPATEADAGAIGTKVDGCSIWVDDYQDGSGEEWKNSILHICLTNNPVAFETEGFEPSENSLSIAMSTSMKNKTDSTSALSELSQTLKDKLGIDLPVGGSELQDYLKMLIAVFKNFKSDTEQHQVVTPSMDIFMSTQNDKTNTETISIKKYNELQEELEALKKRQGIAKKRESALLKVISSTVVNGINDRMEKLKKHYTEEKNEKMLERLNNMESRLTSTQFEFDFKEGVLSKTPIEGELEIIETMIETPEKKKTPEREKDRLVELTPDSEPSHDLGTSDVGGMKVSDIINAF